MSRRLIILNVCLLVALAIGYPLSSARAQTWTITTIDAGGDVGRFTDAQLDASGDLHVTYLRYDNHTLKFISMASGIWGTPTVIDASGYVDGASALSVANDGRKRASYRRTDQGAQWFAGPEAVHTWTFETVAQTGDVGRAASVLRLPTDELAVAYRNETLGALQMIRSVGGVWDAPLTVDPGPGRGLHFDIAYRPGVGYAFSEYDQANGALLLADPALHSPPWIISAATASADNCGQQLQILADSDGGLIASYKNATQGSLEYVRYDGGAWSGPTTVDPGPNRGSYFDITERLGIGLAFSEYDAGNGALIYLDPVLHALPWAIMPATASEDDLGRGLSTILTPEGVLGVTFRDETRGALMHLRYDGGTWDAPITVDPGPSRGSSCDIAYNPVDGFCFSEYDGRNGAAMMAHPRLAARPWVASIVDPTPDAGLQASVSMGPSGRLECAYLVKGTGNALGLRVAEIITGSAYVIRTVADSVGVVGGAITPDVAVAPDLGWSVSYRDPTGQDLCLASTAYFEVLPADVPEEQEESAGVAQMRLLGAFPNPACSGFRVRFVSGKACEGALEIYDATGRRTRRISLVCAAGANEYIFDGMNAIGAALAPGVYFLKLEIGGQDLGSRRIVLLGRDRTQG